MGKRLAEWAAIHGTDKESRHGYCRHYETHLGSYQDHPCMLWEVGVGGYHHRDIGGAGMRMFRDWLPLAHIVGIDVHDKTGLDEGRLHFRKGSQDDRDFMMGVAKEFGRPHIVIDDASHQNDKTVRTFEILFPLLQPGGVYVIEDLESSWWQDDDFKGAAPWDSQKKTAVNLVRSLCEPVCRKYLPHIIDKLAPVHSIHMYSNIAFIHKDTK